MYQSWYESNCNNRSTGDCVHILLKAFCFILNLTRCFAIALPGATSCWYISFVNSATVKRCASTDGPTTAIAPILRLGPNKRLDIASFSKSGTGKRNPWSLQGHSSSFRSTDFRSFPLPNLWMSSRLVTIAMGAATIAARMRRYVDLYDSPAVGCVDSSTASPLPWCESSFADVERGM